MPATAARNDLPTDEQDDAGEPIILERRPTRPRREPSGFLVALENPGEIHNRVAAGVRAATIGKLLFTEAEAAIILGTSPEALKTWRREGAGPPYVRLGEKLIRYAYNDLERYVETLKDNA